MQSLAEIRTEIGPVLKPLEESVRLLEITDQYSYDKMCSVVKQIIDTRHKIVQYLAPGKSAAYKAWKEWTRVETDLLSYVDGAEKMGKDKIAAWDQEQKRLQRLEHDRLEREAIEQVRSQKVADAIQAGKDGAPPAQIKEILEEPEIIAPVKVPETYQRAEGISTREVWSAEVVDLHELVRHVADHPELTHLIKADCAAVNSMARAQKSLLKLPGVRAVKNIVVAGKTR